MRFLKNGLIFVTFFMLITLIVPRQAQAVTLFDSRTAWELSAGSFAAVTSLNGLVDYTNTSSFSLPSGITATFSNPLEVRSVTGVPATSTWATWSGGYIGKVLFTGEATSVIGTFSSQVYGFGFEMEPDLYHDYSLTLLLNDGSSKTQVVNGRAGARFFGWTGNSINSMTLSILNNVPADDEDFSTFAFGNMVEASRSATPEPATISLLGLGLLGLLGFRKKVS